MRRLYTLIGSHEGTFDDRARAPVSSASDLPSGSPPATGQSRPARTTDLSGYGFPARVRRAHGEDSLPGGGRLQRWRSPLRGPWLTSVFGSVLLITVPIVIITGLLSYIAYGPQFGQAKRSRTGQVGEARRSLGRSFAASGWPAAVRGIPANQPKNTLLRRPANSRYSVCWIVSRTRSVNSTVTMGSPASVGS
jgi:hypothetical protein